MKKKLAVYTGISNNLAFAAGNVGTALAKYMRCDYDYIVLYTELSERNKVALREIPNCHPQEFSFPEGFIPYMLQHMSDKSRFRTKEKLMCFSHFEGFRLLKEYKSAMWLDTDVLVTEDLSDMLNEFPIIGLSDDSPWKVGDQFVCKDGLPEQYDYTLPAYRVGMMVLNDVLPYEELYSYCYENAFALAHSLYNPEQAIINLAIQEYQLEVAEIPLEYHADYRDGQGLFSKVVHFGGEGKVWNDRCICTVFTEWLHNHNAWTGEEGDFNIDIKKMQTLFSLGWHFYVFPYAQIPQDANIVIYGFGKVGKDFVKQIKKSGYCHIKAVVDKEIKKAENIGIPAYTPADIPKIKNYDYIVVAINSTIIADEVETNMLDLGVPPQKIVKVHDCCVEVN